MAYPTLAQLKTFLGVSTSDLDTPLTQALNGAIAYIEAACNRNFVKMSGETRSFPVRYPYVFSGRRKLSVYDEFSGTITITNGDGVVITDYNLVPANGPYYYAVELKPGVTSFNDGGTGAMVTIEADWEQDTPNDIFKAVMDLAAFEYRAGQQGSGGEVQTSARGSGLTVQSSDIPEHIQRVIELHTRVAV